VHSALLLDVVVGESAAVFQLLAREDEALLVGGDALYIVFVFWNVSKKYITEK
jgi:hypothetical protein